MTLNLFGVDNKTDFRLGVQNTDNESDNYDVSPHSFKKHDMWLGGSSKPVNVHVFTPRKKYTLLTLYDYDWALHYKKMGASSFESQGVNGSKDFHIELTDTQLSIICYNGTFNGKISRITWNNWQTSFGFDIFSAKNRCDLGIAHTPLLAANAAASDEPVLYPVGWIPYLADWKRAILNNGPFFYYNDPSEIEGVGVLLGIFNGMMFGSNLQKETCEYLPFYNKDEGHYSWVLAPGGNIVYNWNDKLSLDSKNYTRHSELNAGKPVVCAGEMYLSQGVLRELYVELNDSSGHYKPDGGACFKYVLDQFSKIGIPSQNVQLYARNP
jgi:hypothetical protein